MNARKSLRRITDDPAFAKSSPDEFEAWAEARHRLDEMKQEEDVVGLLQELEGGSRHPRITVRPEVVRALWEVGSEEAIPAVARAADDETCMCASPRCRR